MKPDINDLEQCESCEGYFEPDKMQSNGEQSFCKNCDEGFTSEIRKTGIKHLDEYLKSRNMSGDFFVFSHSKFSGITEEEYRELHPD